MTKTTILTLIFLVLTTAKTSPVAADQREAVDFDWQPPAFVARTAAGDMFDYPADLQGPTIVLFWATWCPYCKALMPHIQSIVDEYDDEVRVLALNFREDDDPVAFIEKYGYEFLLIPEADDVAASWGVKGTPGLFLSEQTGRAVFSLRAIPKRAYPTERFANNEELKHYQRAARSAPFWAAKLREALDEIDTRAD